MSTESPKSQIPSDGSKIKTSSGPTGSITPLSGGDLNSFEITVHRLNGRNYLQWAQSVKIVVCARGKLGHLTGDLPAPASSDPSYTTWLSKNSIVLAWLVNSMEPQISHRYLWFNTNKEVWDAAKKMYSDLGNTSQVFEIRSKLKEIKQGSNSVTQYFSDLQDLWKELDLFLEDTKTCTKCSPKIRLNLEKERVFEFLVGLNHDLDDVQGRLVARDSFSIT
ncbi:uncharacterized protein [Henckelia pumila]|uniref:uncharacterized protein n=1 Tax=Henckelia pumila TaxID=405737 RepID=UPI003C6DF67D